MKKKAKKIHGTKYIDTTRIHRHNKETKYIDTKQEPYSKHIDKYNIDAKQHTWNQIHIYIKQKRYNQISVHVDWMCALCAGGKINAQILIGHIVQVWAKTCTRGKIRIPSSSCAVGTINARILNQASRCKFWPKLAPEAQLGFQDIPAPLAQ